MSSERNSFLSNIIFNPLVWIGTVVAVLHLQSKTGADIWNVFKSPATYRNLLIGALIYTALLDKHYTKNREKIAIFENIVATVTNAYIIFFTWLTIIFIVTRYHESGLRYSTVIRERLAEEKIPRTDTNTITQVQNLNLEKGKRYKLTPNADGSFILEVMEN